MSEAPEPPTELVLRGKRIAQDQFGFLSLNDIWRLSGEPEWKSPRKWRTLPTVRELVEALNQTVRFSDGIEKTPEKSAIYSRQGKGGGTFAHVILALAFTEYLSPELGIEVREIALRFWAGDVTLLDDFMERKMAQVVEDSRRVWLREQIRDHNANLQFRILHGLGARNPAQYAAFHNAGHRAMYNGETEDEIHRRKQLQPDQRILDHMGSLEGSANWFRTNLAEERLRNIPVENLAEASSAHFDIGQRVRKVMKDSGSRMPEDLPTADPIAHAKKRLREYGKSQSKLK